MIKKLTKASFDPHKKSKFKVFPEGKEAVELELVDVTEKVTKQTVSFSLLLKGPKDKIVEQGTHKFKHPKMGEVNLFVVPIISEKEDEMQYQVLFNRLIEEE